jgi:hypothetical protein
MAIASLDQYLAALREKVTYFKSGAVTTLANIPYTMFDMAGNPGAGTLSAGNTANGIVPTDVLAGYPLLGAPSGVAYLASIMFTNTVACRLTLYDRVFSCGAYAYNADTTLASQPSFAGRIPGANYSGLELWIETVTAFTLIPAFQINYLDQGGNAGDTGSVSAGVAMTIRRCFQMPLASGDNGIYGVAGIVRVRCITASAGTFNVNVLRPLWSCRVPIANFGDVHDLLRTGMPQIYNDSALFVQIAADSTASGLPEMFMEVASA